MNQRGHRQTLVASQPGNRNRAVHGAYSAAMREPRALEIANEILQSPQAGQLDRVGALEIGRLLVFVEALDAAISEKGLARSGALLDLRLRASGRLERWLAAYGMTPSSRAAVGETLARGSLAMEITRRRAERGQKQC